MTSHPPAEKKMSKADHAQAMSAAFLNHLNESEEQFFAREDQLLQTQREKEAELQHTNSVGNDQGDAGNATGGC